MVLLVLMAFSVAIVHGRKHLKEFQHTLGKREWWRQSWYIWDYVVRELATPFLMSLAVIMFVFLLQFLMRFIDRNPVGRGLDAWTIAQLIALNLAWMVVLAVPMAVLVACVMGFGSLSASNELTAMKAAGGESRQG